MQRYLEGVGRVPAVVDAEERPGSSRGLVTSSFEEGEVFLESEGGAVYRLVWTQAAGGARALPVGRYTLQGYRIVKGEWFSSSTGGRQEVLIEAGETTELAVDPTVKVGLRAFPVRGKISVQFSVRGHARKGLSVYHQGKRIELSYRLTAASGAKVASGTLEYG